MKFFSLIAFLIVAAGVACQAVSADVLVTNQQEFASAVKAARPGDTIVMANGEWRDFEMVFSATGTADRPITLRAQTKGEVSITGLSNLSLAGEYLVVSGLVFKDGHTPTNTVISFRTGADRLANHSRVTEVVIDRFNNPERHETDFWVMMYGRHNRFDHNHLEGKSNSGVTMAVRLNTENSQQNHHRIDHNYFGPRQALGSNGGETLRIGTSQYSLTDSNTLVEYNYFDRCNGEVEIISSKSGKNVFRGNVFFESRGTLTLRHGNDNLIEDNAFLGNGVDHTGGIRVINKRQTVRNNYMSGLKGYRFGGALVIMNGVPDSPINRYHQVEDSVVENNSIVDSDHIEFAAGSDSERSAPPIRTSFRNNLIVNQYEQDSIAVHDDISGIAFTGNVVSGVVKLPADDGFESRQISLQLSDAGVLYPDDASLATVGVARSLTITDRDATGASWYPKPGYGGVFDGGDTIRVEAGLDTLTDAIAASKPGDIIDVSPGDYVVSKFIDINHPITIRGDAARPSISFERTALFEIKDGGSLKLENLVINGSQAPDAYGNAVIRTSRNSMLQNYTLQIDNVHVENLNTNHSFNFFKASMHTFAADIGVRNSSFENISGHVLALDVEVDDLGIYNAEYIVVTDSTFTSIEGSLATVYRGGTDESTFGPHFTLANSKLESVGRGRRNKSQASVFLHGVQVAELRGNTFAKSAPLRIELTVGDPVTTLSDNAFDATPAPSIGEFRRPGT